jgi:hypothetical protein
MVILAASGKPPKHAIPNGLSPSATPPSEDQSARK